MYRLPIRLSNLPIKANKVKSMKKLCLKLSKNKNVTLRETKRHLQRTVSLQVKIEICYLESTEIPRERGQQIFSLHWPEQLEQMVPGQS